MSAYEITNRDVRRLFMERQGLYEQRRAKMTDVGLRRLICTLGFVQVDSINTVARAHHMILFSRNQTYRPVQLTRLLEKDRALFEHWTHDASVIPIEFYPYWKYRFKRDQKALLARWRKGRHEGFEEIFDEILAQVQRDGATMSRNIGSKRKTGRGWWDWHPEKTALEYHWRTGNLAIAGRDGFQKIYDLTERVIPKEYREASVDEATFIAWACVSALERLGAATSGEIAAFWNLVTSKETAAWCKTAMARGDLLEVIVHGADGGQRPTKAYTFPDLPDSLTETTGPPDRLRVLSPFDPLIRDRKRTRRIFGFDYRIEIFVPKHKRQYGYYVFPILEGDSFIGRINMIHRNGVLTVTGFWPERGVRIGKIRRAALEAELERYCRFIGAERAVFECEVS